MVGRSAQALVSPPQLFRPVGAFLPKEATMLGRWDISRRNVLKALGLGGLTAGAAQLPGSAARAEVPAMPVEAPRVRPGQPEGQWAVQLHAHANWFVSQLPWTSPLEVINWYLTHQFNAVALTNLNHHTPVQGLQGVFNDPGQFIVIQGSEPSLQPDGIGVRIVDTLAVGLDRPVDLGAANRGTSSVEILTNQAKAIRAAGGLPIAAHPNLTWSLTAEDIAESDPGSHPRFFELVNTEPGINWRGGGGRPSTEEMWDRALTLSGRRIFGIAADDSHHFFEWSKSRRPDEPLSNPGRAWIMVLADELSWPKLRQAMEAGNFYATMGQTGITLVNYEADRTSVKITLDASTTDLGWSIGHNNDRLYTTLFIGAGGKTLKTDTSAQPSYVFKPSDRYVRARIEDSDGNVAWTQPVFR
jgi:hypothetical protein